MDETDGPCLSACDAATALAHANSDTLADADAHALARHPFQPVRTALVHRPDLDFDTWMVLAGDPAPAIRREVARSPFSPDEARTLAALAA